MKTYQLQIRDRLLPSQISEKEFNLLNKSVQANYKLSSEDDNSETLTKAFVNDNDTSLHQRRVVDNYEADSDNSQTLA